MYAKQGQNSMQQPLLQNQIDPFSPPAYDTSPQNDIRQSYAADLNLLNERKLSYHVKSLIATLFVWIVIPVIAICSTQKVIDLSAGAVGGICGGIYLFYLLLSMCCNPLFKYLSNIQHGNRFRQQYQRVQGLIGNFVFSAECYHYQTRHHTRQVSDGNGGYKTQHYTTTQKVVTHSATQIVRPVYTTDQSGSVDDVRAATTVVFIHYLVNYRFVDNMSRQNFDYEWYRFKRNNTFDVHQNFYYNYSVPGLVQRMTFFIGQKKPNWYGYLIFWSFLGMIWPYSMYIQSKTSRFDIKFLKILTMAQTYYR